MMKDGLYEWWGLGNYFRQEEYLVGGGLEWMNWKARWLKYQEKWRQIRSDGADQEKDFDFSSRFCGKSLEGFQWKSLAPRCISKRSLEILPSEAWEKQPHHMTWSNSVMPTSLVSPGVLRTIS
jgi:hypothetical protein